MIKKSVVVFGLGKFGQSVAIELANAGADVLAIDKQESRTHDVADLVTCAVSGDVCDPDTLDNLGISNMDTAIVAITGSVEASIMATLYAKEAGVAEIFAKAKDGTHEKILRKVGADKVIIPEHEAGVRIARQVLTGNVLDFVELSKRIRMVEITVRPEWIGHSLIELDLRRKERINIVAIREEEKFYINIDPKMVLSKEMTLLITIDKKDLAHLLN